MNKNFKSIIELFIPKDFVLRSILLKIITPFQRLNWQNTAIDKDRTKNPILYFGKEIPTSTGLVHGGAVKLQNLKHFFKVSKEQCNIIYLASSSLPPAAYELLNIAKRRGVKIVWNQNGVSYPASMPKKWKGINAILRRLIHLSDYVLYQSEFCKKSSDEFLGQFNGPSDIVYNCVDTNFFKPKTGKRPQRSLTILLGGHQCRKYRIETALYTLVELHKHIPKARLIVTGKVHWFGQTRNACEQQARNLVRQLNICDHVDFTGPYTQKNAPNIFSQADILLHPIHMDACPGLVVEAMSCGLPVVHSHSGGTPELVGEKAGIGVINPNNWKERTPPDPIRLSKAIVKVWENLEEYSTNTRMRAAKHFNITSFIEKHKKIFSSVLNL